jgi:hypothetical protein
LFHFGAHVLLRHHFEVRNQPFHGGREHLRQGAERATRNSVMAVTMNGEVQIAATREVV